MATNYENLLLKLGEMQSAFISSDSRVLTCLKACQDQLDKTISEDELSVSQIETLLSVLQKKIPWSLAREDSILIHSTHGTGITQSSFALFSTLLVLALDKKMEIDKVIASLNHVAADGLGYAVHIARYQSPVEISQYIKMLNDLMDKGMPAENVMQHLESLLDKNNTSFGVLTGSKMSDLLSDLKKRIYYAMSADDQPDNTPDALKELMQLLLRLTEKKIEDARIIGFLQAESKSKFKEKSTIGYLLIDSKKYQDILTEFYQRKWIPETLINRLMENSDVRTKIISANQDNIDHAYQLMLELVARLQTEAFRYNYYNAFSPLLSQIIALFQMYKDNLNGVQVEALLNLIFKPLRFEHNALMCCVRTSCSEVIELAVQLFEELTLAAIDKKIAISKFINAQSYGCTFGVYVVRCVQSSKSTKAIEQYFKCLGKLIDKGYSAEDIFLQLRNESVRRYAMSVTISNGISGEIDSLVMLVCQLSQHKVDKSKLGKELAYGYSPMGGSDSVISLLCNNPVNYKNSIKKLIDHGVLPYDGFTPTRALKTMLVDDIKAITDAKARLAALEDACVPGGKVYKILSIKRWGKGEIDESKGRLSELNALLKEARAQNVPLSMPPVEKRQILEQNLPDIASIVSSLSSSDSTITNYLHNDDSDESRNYLYDMAQFEPRILYLLFVNNLVREQDFTRLTEVGMQEKLGDLFVGEKDLNTKRSMMMRSIQPGEMLRSFMAMAKTDVLARLRAEATALVQPASTGAGLYPALPRARAADLYPAVESLPGSFNLS